MIFHMVAMQWNCVDFLMLQSANVIIWQAKTVHLPSYEPYRDSMYVVCVFLSINQEGKTGSYCSARVFPWFSKSPIQERPTRCLLRCRKEEEQVQGAWNRPFDFFGQSCWAYLFTWITTMVRASDFCHDRFPLPVNKWTSFWFSYAVYPFWSKQDGIFGPIGAGTLEHRKIESETYSRFILQGDCI